ncbi:hypothetical protein H0H87_009475, partial [Tephrocybe sp. NHM501043]
GLAGAWEPSINRRGESEHPPSERNHVVALQNVNVVGSEDGEGRDRNPVNPTLAAVRNSFPRNQGGFGSHNDAARPRESHRQVSIRQEVDFMYIPNLDQISRQEGALRPLNVQVAGGNDQYPSLYTTSPNQPATYRQGPGRSLMVVPSDRIVEMSTILAASIGYYLPTPANTLGPSRVPYSPVRASHSVPNHDNPTSTSGYRAQATLDVAFFDRPPAAVRTNTEPHPNKGEIRRAILGDSTETGWECMSAMDVRVRSLTIWAKVDGIWWARAIITAPTNGNVTVHDVVSTLNKIGVPVLGTGREKEELKEVYRRMFGERYS